MSPPGENPLKTHLTLRCLRVLKVRIPWLRLPRRRLREREAGVRRLNSHRLILRRIRMRLQKRKLLWTQILLTKVRPHQTVALPHVNEFVLTVTTVLKPRMRLTTKDSQVVVVYHTIVMDHMLFRYQNSGILLQYGVIRVLWACDSLVLDVFWEYQCQRIPCRTKMMGATQTRRYVYPRGMCRMAIDMSIAACI
jgi:hypothetical protein